MLYKDKLVLSEGQSLVHKGSRSKGFMQETDIDTYDVVDQAGAKVGEVIVKDHTAVKGSARTVSVTQRDSSGKVLVDESWNPPR